MTAPDDPIARYEAWSKEAHRCGRILEPAAACLSTVDSDGWPEGRMVLIKRIEEEPFVFFTNTGSSKARALAVCPRASLTIHWEELGRQVRIQGSVEPLDEAAADAYFATRPRWSQLGAWASAQSRPLESPRALLRDVARTALRYWRSPVPRPPHWGGYRLIPRSIEFWQRRAHRLHNRELYRREADGSWSSRRLYP